MENEKIFGEMSPKDINELAENLVKEGKPDEVKLLAKENGIDQKRVESYLLELSPTLVDEPAEQNKEKMEQAPVGTEANTEKTEQEEKKISEKETGASKIKKQCSIPEVVDYITSKCKDPEYEKLVLQKHKSWDRCYAYMKNKARDMQKDGMAMVPDHVGFDWIDEYFRKDDKAEVEKAEEKKQETNKVIAKPHAKKPEQKKPVVKEKAPKKEPNPEEPKIIVPVEKKTEKPKNSLDGQLSLFDLM